MIHLKKIGLSATRTVRQNRVKTKIDVLKKVERGTTISVHEANSKLNYITVMDSKPVSILSTFGDKPKVEMQRCIKSLENLFFFHVHFLCIIKIWAGSIFMINIVMH